MARDVYSDQLSSGETALAAFADLLVLEVPIGQRWIMNGAIFRVGPLKPTSSWGMYIKPSASAVPIWFYTTGLPSSGLQVETFDGRMVLDQGDQIRTQSEGTAPDAVMWLLSGYKLTLP